MLAPSHLVRCLLTEEKGPQPQRVGSTNRPRVPKKGPGSRRRTCAPGGASSFCEVLPQPPQASPWCPPEPLPDHSPLRREAASDCSHC